MLSSTAEYALRAVLYVAQHATDAPVRVSQIASALKLPHNYLSKILHELTKSGVLVSTRGKHGGFELGRPANHLSLYAIVNRFDRIEARRACLLGAKACADRHACAVHWRWKEISEQVVRFFRDTTVGELLSGTGVPA
ncbi:MAG: Rrf2 family transcriptional regulator [Gemmatimonadetes bacterium]|nr:Rrf2 family transcriptional regulator [Gemmatimonadota bacterium]